MAQYRKKPLVIEAVQFTDKESPPDGVKWGNYYDYQDTSVTKCWMILTLEGAHIVTLNDWIITGVKGEKYACKPDIFALTYEPVN